MIPIYTVIWGEFELESVCKRHRGNMKQSVTQILDFFKKHKYGKMTLALVLVGTIVAGTLFFTAKPKEEPIPLSEVASSDFSREGHQNRRFSR